MSSPQQDRLRVQVGTWNVNRQSPRKHKQLEKWLVDPTKKATEGRSPDVYVIGLQEITHPMDSTGNGDVYMKDWIEMMMKCLNPNNEYILLACKRLAGTCIFVFVQSYLDKQVVSDIEMNAVSCDSVLNNITQKGGVGIRFNLLGTPMCFVCCHLTHGCGLENASTRNENFHEICKKLDFPKGGNMSDHEYVFMFGDLNYRLCGNQNSKTTKKEIKDNKLAELFERDELTVQKAFGTAFVGFNEAAVGFQPTYKFKLNTSKYQGGSLPAWTDRILWRRKVNDYTSGEPDQGSVLAYDRAEHTSSDHKPVLGVFDLPLNGARLPVAPNVPMGITHLPGVSNLSSHSSMMPSSTQMSSSTQMPHSGGQVETQMDAEGWVRVNGGTVTNLPRTRITTEPMHLNGSNDTGFVHSTNPNNSSNMSGQMTSSNNSRNQYVNTYTVNGLPMTNSARFGQPMNMSDYMVNGGNYGNHTMGMMSGGQQGMMSGGQQGMMSGGQQGMMSGGQQGMTYNPSIGTIHQPVQRIYPSLSGLQLMPQNGVGTMGGMPSGFPGQMMAPQTLNAPSQMNGPSTLNMMEQMYSMPQPGQMAPNMNPVVVPVMMPYGTISRGMTFN